MDEMVRTRLLMLAMAGTLLIAGGWIWTNARHAKEVKTTERLGLDNPSPSSAVPPAAQSSLASLTNRLNRTPSSSLQRQPAISGVANPLGAATMAGAGLPAAPSSLGVRAVPPVAPALADQGSGSPEQKIATGPTPATSLQAALAEAKSVAGHKDDPYKPIQEFKPFPRFQVAEAEVIPPPPKAELVPPPPPEAESALGEGLSVDELPPPPAKPSVAEKMKLIAIVGDRAILSFPDAGLREENKWPKTLTLGSGEKFESVSVVDVSPDSITLDEDGERSVKSMDPIK